MPPPVTELSNVEIRAVTLSSLKYGPERRRRLQRVRAIAPQPTSRSGPGRKARETSACERYHFHVVSFRQATFSQTPDRVISSNRSEER